MKEIGRKVFRDQELCILSVLHSVQDKYINFPCTSQLSLMSESCRDVRCKEEYEVYGIEQ